MRLLPEGLPGLCKLLRMAVGGFGIGLFHLQQVTPLYAALTNGDVMQRL